MRLICIPSLSGCTTTPLLKTSKNSANSPIEMPSAPGPRRRRLLRRSTQHGWIRATASGDLPVQIHQGTDRCSDRAPDSAFSCVASSDSSWRSNDSNIKWNGTPCSVRFRPGPARQRELLCLRLPWIPWISGICAVQLSSQRWLMAVGNGVAVPVAEFGKHGEVPARESSSWVVPSLALARATMSR